VTNWAGNIEFHPRAALEPTSVDELRGVVGRSDGLRVLGTGHSFNDIAVTGGDQISLRSLPTIIDIDREASTVRVSAGLRYGDVTPTIQAAGFALPNLGSLPHITIAGACATGTHGSGDGNGILATAVRSLDLVTAGGDVVTLTRGDADFPGAVVGLGALGVVTELTLDLRPTFDIRQYVYLGLPMTELYENFDEVASAAYSVSVFTDWRTERANQVWLKSATVRAEGDFLGAGLAPAAVHPVPGVSAESTTEQGGVPGPWHERLPHFRLDFMPSKGEELQTEYFVAREHAVAAIKALHSLRESISPVLMISEIRTFAADDLWLSPANGQSRVALHFTWIRDMAAVVPVLDRIEAALAPFSAVPHWGKVFAMSGQSLQRLHPRLAAFAELARRYDPSGKLANDYLRRNVLGL
jgi:xylitol oxidase